MPTFRSGQIPPEWCELRSFDILELAEGELIEQERRQRKERLIATLGTTQLLLADGSIILKENQFFDLPPLATWRLRGCSAKAEVVRLSGHWGNELGGCGIFRVAHDEHPVNRGDPVTYPKSTSVDRHFHDCDEYWIVLEGSGTVVIEDRSMAVSVGDCVPLGMGHSHDLPAVTVPIKAVFFETTLQDAKRVGHLWLHTHGPAEAKPGRI
ncbi:MAG: hypothetical protein HYR63_01070 [Proteobacteria bacterium]|nr:hypothetical protein [Pseudomonadota bacterium]